MRVKKHHQTFKAICSYGLFLTYKIKVCDAIWAIIKKNEYTDKNKYDYKINPEKNKLDNKYINK